MLDDSSRSALGPGSCQGRRSTELRSRVFVCVCGGKLSEVVELTDRVVLCSALCCLCQLIS